MLYGKPHGSSGYGMDQTVSLSTANLFPLFKNVRLKIVDENLQVLNEYAVCLDLKVNSDVVNGICILEFNEPGILLLLSIK